MARKAGRKAQPKAEVFRRSSGTDGLGQEAEPKARVRWGGTKGRHLLHLAALMLLLCFFALTAMALGATVAFAIFLPLGILVELKFWWTLFTPDRNRRQGPN